MSKNERRKIAIDESRIWNMEKTRKKNYPAGARISFSDSYLFNDKKIQIMFNRRDIDFTEISKNEKAAKMIDYLKNEQDRRKNFKRSPYFFSFYPFSYGTVLFVRNNIFKVFPDRTIRIFVPKNYHEKRRTNFLKNLCFVGEKPEINERNFCGSRIIGRKLYEYYQRDNSPFNITGDCIDFFFPKQTI